MVFMNTHDMNRGKAPLLKVYVGVGALPSLASLGSRFILLLLRFEFDLLLVFVVGEASCV